MVAVLEDAGTNTQILRIRNLDTDTQWRTVAVPLYTGTIQFSLQGHELLLTHNNPAASPMEYLSKLDLDHPERGVELIYEAGNLAFPVEVAPGQVMVRTRLPTDPGTHRLSGYYWVLVGPGEQVQRVGPEKILPYSAPNIVGTGFYWVDQQIGSDEDAHPRLLKYALPGGSAPDITSEQFDRNTSNIRCDRHANRCLRVYIANRGQAAKFIYDIEVFLGMERCHVPGVAGFSDRLSITPDGNTAVMSLAPSYDDSRHVVVMHFKAQQCAPISIRHIYFDKESS
jgi:hypothetical protein